MKEQLLLLLELQAIDMRVQELRTVIEALPKKVNVARADLTRLEAILDAEKQRLAQTEAWRKEQELLVQTDDDAIRKAKIKLQGVKNSKDYAAATRELENKRRSKAERDDELLKMMEATESTRTKLQAHEQDVEALRAKVRQEEAVVAAEIERLQAEATERASGRTAIAARIERSLLKRYENVMMKRGFAVSPLTGGICNGCHMSVPPQLSNVLARLDSIESCPRCNRLLYREELLQDRPQEHSS